MIIWKLDRFTRNRYDSAHYKAQLRKYGVNVLSATENISEGPEGIILESMLERMAEKGVTTVRGQKIDLNFMARLLKNRKYIVEYSYRKIITPRWYSRHCSPRPF